MYNPDTELIFPMRVIPELQSLRGEVWQDFVKNVNSYEENTVDKLAFVLLMVKMAGCVTCSADAFRAMKGCTQCAKQTVRRFRGEDEQIIENYKQVKSEVSNYINDKGIRLI